MGRLVSFGKYTVIVGFVMPEIDRSRGTPEPSVISRSSYFSTKVLFSEPGAMPGQMAYSKGSAACAGADEEITHRAISKPAQSAVPKRLPRK